jgi:hypothetical protein
MFNKAASVFYTGWCNNIQHNDTHPNWVNCTHIGTHFTLALSVVLLNVFVLSVTAPQVSPKTN